MKKFVITTNPDTASKMQRLGFKLINCTDKQWFFLNDEKLFFSDMKDIVYSDKMFI